MIKYYFKKVKRFFGSIISLIYLRLSIFKSKRRNLNLFRTNKISKIEYELRKDFLKKTEQFGTTDFYQNYPPLKMSGSRNTISRLKTYNLLSKVNKKMTALDIGGNICFFSIYLSKYLKHIDVVEQNKNLTDIGLKLMKYEKIKNVKIYNQDFKKFKSNKKYDLILSLAIHKWVGLTFEKYLNKISCFMHKDTLLLLESHAIYYNDGDYLKDKINNFNFLKIIDSGIVDDHNGISREFYFLKLK